MKPVDIEKINRLCSFPDHVVGVEIDGVDSLGVSVLTARPKMERVNTDCWFLYIKAAERLEDSLMDLFPPNPK